MRSEVPYFHCYEDRFSSEAHNAVSTNSGAGDVDGTAIAFSNTRGDPMGIMQRNRLQVLDGQPACDSRRSGDPQREAKQVIARGGDGPAVGETWRADVPFIECDVRVHLLPSAEDRKVQSMRIVWPTAHTRRSVRR